ncbi:MAG: hypothetical protein IGS39_21895 [Calothrix sp. C42_A2020_038]|nr:hypothetical protein [Calothrix sp. C42_A2020_038]
MSKTTYKLRNSVKMLGAIFGGMLVSLPAILPVQAQQSPTIRPGSQVNPCPSIFYEEPHNNRVMVPEGCTPNAFTARVNAERMGMSPTPEQTRLGVGGEAPVPSPAPLNQPNQGIPSDRVDSSTGIRISGPAGGYTSRRLSQGRQTSSSRYQNAIAAVSPTAGRVTVRLVNKTNAPITFQAVGDTQVRTLAGRSKVSLQGLQVPTTVTFYRQDRGLLMVTPKTTSESGVLEVSMQETTDFAMDRTALRIENNGAVYLN